MTRILKIPYESGIITTTLTLVFDLMVLFVVERALDQIERRVARRRLAVSGRYRYSRWKVRLPLVGRIDIGGDAQIRTKRRCVLLLTLFVSVTALEVNINGKSEDVIRKLTIGDLGKNQVVIKPRKPLKEKSEIQARLRVRVPDIHEEWLSMINAVPPSLTAADTFAWSYMSTAVQRESNGQTSMRSIVGGLEVLNETSDWYDASGIFPPNNTFTLSRNKTWSEGPILHKNRIIDVNFTDTFYNKTTEENKLKNQYQSCDNLLELVIKPKNIVNYMEKGEKLRASVRGSNDSVICAGIAFSGHERKSGKDEWFYFARSKSEKNRKVLHCADVIQNSNNEPEQIIYFIVSAVNVTKATVERALQEPDASDGKVRIPLSDDNVYSPVTCMQIGRRTSDFPIPLHWMFMKHSTPFSPNLQEFTNLIQEHRISNLDFLNEAFWFSAIEPSRNISGFEITKGQKTITEVNIVYFGIWISVLSISILYLVITSLVSAKRDRIGEKIEIDVEEAKNIAASWKSDLTETEHCSKPTEESQLVLVRSGFKTIQLTTVGNPEPLEEDDVVVYNRSQFHLDEEPVDYYSSLND